MNRRHVGGQGKRHRARMTARAGPELSPGQHQNRANKSQDGVMLRAEWRAQQAKQRTEREATKNDLCCRNNCKTGEWLSRRYAGGQDKGRSEGTAKGRREWMVSTRARRGRMV